MKTMISYFKNNLYNESKGIQKIRPEINVVVYGPSILPFPLMKEIKSGQNKYTYKLEMVFQRENHGFFTLEIMYATKSRVSKK